MGKVLILVFLLLKYVDGLGRGKRMTEEEFRKIPDDPFSDPVDDIPVVPQQPLRDQNSRRPSISEQLLPRDQYLKETETRMSPSQSRDRAAMWTDFEKLHDKLIQEQARPDATTRKPYKRVHQDVPKLGSIVVNEKYGQFEPGTFQMKDDSIFMSNPKFNMFKPINWTTCDQFKRTSQAFNPDDITNIDWTPFFVWSDKPVYTAATVHKFRKPTLKEVYDTNIKFGKYLNRTVDWNKPKLQMVDELRSEKTLLLAIDNTGWFHYILDMELPEYVQRNKVILPVLTLRLKIVGDYLAMMYCDMNFAMIMAREGHVPKTNKEKTTASKVLGFKGKGRPVKRYIKEEQNRREALESMREESSEAFDSKAVAERPIGRRRKSKSKTREQVLKDDPYVIPDRIVS